MPRVNRYFFTQLYLAHYSPLPQERILTEICRDRERWIAVEAPLKISMLVCLRFYQVVALSFNYKLKQKCLMVRGFLTFVLASLKGKATRRYI